MLRLGDEGHNLRRIRVPSSRRRGNRSGEEERERGRASGCLIGLALSAVIAVCDSFAISLPSIRRAREIARIGEAPRLYSRASFSFSSRFPSASRGRSFADHPAINERDFHGAPSEANSPTFSSVSLTELQKEGARTRTRITPSSPCQSSLSLSAGIRALFPLRPPLALSVS